MARETTTRRKRPAAEEAPPTEPGAALAPGRDPAELHERIRRRAYELWEREGRPADRHEEHWRRAEQEIATEARGAASAPSAPSGTEPQESGAEAAPAAEPAAEAPRARRRAPAKRSGTEPGTTARRRDQTG